MPKSIKRPLCFGDYYLSGAYVEQCNICEFKAECEQADTQDVVKRSMQRMGLEYQEPEADNGKDE